MPARRQKPTSVDQKPNLNEQARVLKLASDIACAFVANNQIGLSELSKFLVDIHASLRQLAGDAEPSPTPATPIKKSVSDDFIICLEDGKKLRTLKRYLMTHYQLTPDDYRKRWSLPLDYPMVAPSYAVLRSDFAKKMGLGRKPGRRRK